MNEKLKKLIVNQETLRNLIHHTAPAKLKTAGTHTCDGMCPSHHPPHCMGLPEGARRHR